MDVDELRTALRAVDRLCDGALIAGEYRKCQWWVAEIQLVARAALGLDILDLVDPIVDDDAGRAVGAREMDTRAD